MFIKIYHLFLPISFSYFICASGKATYFEPCRLSDPEFEKCLKNTTQYLIPIFVKGIPELGLESLDTFSVDDIHETASANLEFYLSNITIFDISNVKVKSAKLDPKKKKIVLNYTNRGKMTANYKVDGRLIIIPITGDGDALFILDVEVELKLYYDIIKGKDGINHWKIIKHKANFNPIHIEFSLTNLFNGNKELSDIVIRFANENWRELFPDLAKPTLVKTTRKVLQYVDKFFGAFSDEELLVP